MLHRSLKTQALCLALAGLVFGQGLTTTASKDDWEEINFEFDSSILTDGYPSLLRLAELLNQNPDYKVALVGHADQIGSQDYNNELALKRANTVKEFLEKNGTRIGQITANGRGEDEPKVDQQNDEARFMNRRVQMIVTDAEGRRVSAGGVGDAIKALEELAKNQEECCEATQEKLDKLGDVPATLKNLETENAQLRGEIDSLKEGQSGIEKQVAGLPKPLTREQVTQVADEAVEKVEANKMPRFSLLGFNVGADNDGDITFTGRGRYFAHFKNNFAIQAEGEFLGFDGRKEGQFDIGIVGRRNQFQIGGFTSFKHVSLSDYQNGGTLGQASITADYIFSYGKVGLFGSKGFMEKALINTQNISRNIIENTYLRTVDQAGVSMTVGMWERNWLEGNLGYLSGRVHGNKPGGTLRAVFPFADRWAFTIEGGFNETLLSSGTNGRFVAGIQFGNFIEPKTFATIDHPVPVDIPRVRYELLVERVRTGNDAPVADAGPDLIGIPAGSVTLDASASFDPDDDPITFLWAQVAGPTVALTGADTATANFTAADGQVYGFRLTVSDDQGAKSLDRISITTKETPKARILAFTATPSSIKIGGSSTLTWQVENADEVTIEGIGAVDVQTGTLEVTPTETTIYKLIATNSVGEAQASVAVVVDQPEPSFLRCQVTPANILEGETATVAWETINASAVTLTGFGSVALSGYQTVSPTQNTTYTLEATNSIGSISCPVTVQVTRGDVPRILSFYSSPMEILAGSTAMLNWQVEDASSITIDNGVGAVNSKIGSIPVTPSQTTTYTITAAKNEFGSVSTSVTITVIQPAKITSFTATPSQLANPSDVFILSWATENATDVEIDNLLGPRPASGSVPLQAGGGGTYTIVASNKFSQATATVTVEVGGGTP